MALSRSAQQLNLHPKRRILIQLILLLPLIAALIGFSRRLVTQPSFPAALVEKTPRGKILASDGTILAEGFAGERIYPQGNLAAHLIGFSGELQNKDTDQYGLEGLELTYESVLRTGQDVLTTIDPNLQAVAQAKLAEVVTSVRAENGAVVMLEARYGSHCCSSELS